MAKHNENDVTLPAPALHFPVDEDIIDGSTVVFIWEPVEGANRYRLEVATDSSFDNVVFEYDVYDRNTFTVANVFSQDNELYYWRVLAANETGWSNGDHVEAFISSTPEVVSEQLATPQERFGPPGELFKGAGAEAAAVFGEKKYQDMAVAMGVERDRVEAGQIIGIALAVLFAIVTAIIVLFQWVTVREEATYQAVVEGAEYPELRQVEASAAEKLGQYGVVDGGEGVYRIPIERAMELIVNENFQEQNRNN